MTDQDKLSDVRERCIRIETQTVSIDQHLKRLNGKVAQHETRLQEQATKLTAISGKKYQSPPGEWAADAFTCAGFRMSTPQYFQYQWVRMADDHGEAIALADLDGDGAAEQRFTIAVHCPSPSSCRAEPPAP